MKESRNKKILYLMEYPIDLPGGGQMSTKTLCEGMQEISQSRVRPSSTDAECFDGANCSAGTQDGYVWETIACCPNLLTHKPEDYSFKICTYDSDENRELSKVSRVKNFVTRIGSFYRIIRQEKPDIIHVSMSESLITFGFLRCLGIFHKIPFVYTDRGLAYGYRKHSKFCMMKTLSHAAAMITTTEFNHHLWEEENVPCPVRVIPNTISADFETFEPEKKESVRAKYGFSKDDFVIGLAGRISEEKDWPCVGRLMEALTKEGISFKVALVLSTYEERDTQIAADIKADIVKYIGEDNLYFLHDLSQKEMADYYYLPNVFVMTSSFESFGKAAVEAMSRKCPVLSTSVGGLTEVIGKAEDLYDKENLSVFAKRMKEFADCPQLASEEGEYFFHRYHTLFTRNIHLSRHDELYGEILK